MKSKWYFSTLFLIFACFFALNQEISIPNQEIVLEFSDVRINEKDVKNTITDVKEKLLKIGVSNIKVLETENGTLKISYYSLVNIDNIKEVLLNENQLALNKNSEKQEKDNLPSDYSIDIYELTNEIDELNLDDKLIFETKPISNRFTSNKIYTSLKRDLEIHKANQLYKTAFKLTKNDSFSKKNSSYSEPEVRAGPYTKYI